MPRYKTVAQKRARDLHKSDALAQTNQSMTAFFAWHRKHKNIFSRSKTRN